MTTSSSVRIVEGRKYVWDGIPYHDEAEAARAAEAYRVSRFDVQVVAQGGEWLLFTRREPGAAYAVKG